MKDAPNVSQHLPADARAMLVKASQVAPTPGDPLARSKAIDKAVDRIKTQYPHLYRSR